MIRCIDIICQDIGFIQGVMDMKRYRVEFTETKSYEAFVEANNHDEAIAKVRDGQIEDEELIEKDVIIDGMYLQSKS